MSQTLNTPLKDYGALEDAQMEVFRLEQEARRALEENKRYCKDPSNKQKYSIHVHILYTH